MPSPSTQHFQNSFPITIVLIYPYLRRYFLKGCMRFKKKFYFYKKNNNMQKNRIFGTLIILLLAGVISLHSCKKDEETRPTSNEAINILQPDSTTIFADAGSTVNFELYLAVDEVIDTIMAGYLLDSTMINYNLTLADMDSIFFGQGFVDSNNVQTVTGSITLPQYWNDTVPFQTYFSGSTTPYIPESYDACRIVFRMETESGIQHEKQLKIIFN